LKVCILFISEILAKCGNWHAIWNVEFFLYSMIDGFREPCGSTNGNPYQYCGTAGKPGGQQRKQTSTYRIGRNRSTRLNLHREHFVSDPLFKRSVATLGEQGVIDLVGVSGYYTLVSMVLNVAEIPLPPGEKSPW